MSSNLAALFQQSFAGNEPLTAPLTASLAVTERCNSHCLYCPPARVTARHDPAGDDVIGILADLASLGVRQVSLTGGEPLLRHDLAAIVRASAERDLRTIILTNGSLLTEARGQELLAAGAAGFVVSLDSLSDEVYRLVRGRPLAATMRGLEVLAGLKQRFPDLIACATAVITRHNGDQLGEVAAFLAAHRLGFQVQPCLDAPEEEVDARDRMAMAAIAQGLIEIQAQYAGRMDAAERAYLAHIPDYLASRQLPPGHRCLAAYAVVHISADFDLFPCWLLPTVGNLRQTSLTELWHSPAMRAGRERIQAGNCPRCWLLCDAKPSLAYRLGVEGA